MTPMGAVHKEVGGDTMTDMMKDGLVKFGVNNAGMKIALLAVLLEEVGRRVSEQYL